MERLDLDYACGRASCRAVFEFAWRARKRRRAPTKLRTATSRQTLVAAERRCGGPGATLYRGLRRRTKGGTLYAARRLSDDFLDRYAEIETQTGTYSRSSKQSARVQARNFLALDADNTAAAIHDDLGGAFPFQAGDGADSGAGRSDARNFARKFRPSNRVSAQDELGTLVRSFNRMTEQLGEGPRQINEFTQSLEQAVEERERRRKLMETILENIPTGVVSLNAAGEVARVNSAVATILGDYAREARVRFRNCWARRRRAR